jgi:hypothetical protein
MSDMSQGAGWWQASDGKWYAPERHPDYLAPAPVTVPAPVTGMSAPVAPSIRRAPINQAMMAQALAGQSTIGQRAKEVTLPYSDGGGPVQVLDRDIHAEEGRRPATPRSVLADTAVGADVELGVHLGSGTVSSQVPVLRLFIYVIVGAFSLQVLPFLALGDHGVNGLALLTHNANGLSHSLLLLAYLGQVLMILDVAFLLALLLSRSFRVVTTLLGISLTLGIVTVALSAAGRFYVNAAWAVVWVLFVGYVRRQVKQEAGRASFHEGGRRRFSALELGLAVYIILITVGFGALTWHSYRTVSVSTPSAQATIVYADGAHSTGPATDPAPTTYVEQTVSAHDFTVSLRFDPNSSAVVDYHTAGTVGTLPVPGLDRVAITGDQLNATSQVVVTVNRLGPTGTAPTDVAPCPPPGHVDPIDVSVPVTVMGQSTSVCGLTDQAVATFSGAGGEYEVEFTAPFVTGTPPPLNALVIGAIADSIKVG